MIGKIEFTVEAVYNNIYRILDRVEPNAFDLWVWENFYAGMSVSIRPRSSHSKRGIDANNVAYFSLSESQYRDKEFFCAMILNAVGDLRNQMEETKYEEA